MASLGLTIDAGGHTQWSSILGRVSRDLRDFTPLWERIEANWYESRSTMFGSQGASTGARWAPLSPAYARRKATTHPGRTILVREGDLRDGLTRRGGAGQIRRVTSTSLTLGTADPKAGYHSSPGGRRKMPLRNVIAMSPGDVAHWQALGAAWVKGVLKAAGADAAGASPV